jgi:hypothetical protein
LVFTSPAISSKLSSRGAKSSWRQANLPPKGLEVKGTLLAEKLYFD